MNSALNPVLEKPKIGSLTSLRFVAAALVAYQHAGSPAFFRHQITIFDTRYAVSFFFVLSGFILSHAHKEMAHPGLYRSFMAARISRLWPAHIVTAALALFVVDRGVPDFAWKAVLNAMMLHSWAPLMSWYYSLNAVSWSIATEMAFYSVFPVLLIASRRSSISVAAAAMGWTALLIGAASIMGLAGTETDPGVTSWWLLYISPIGRVAEFALGVAAYSATKRAAAAIDHLSANRATILEVAALVLTFIAMVSLTRLAEVTAETAPSLSVWLRVASPGVVFAALLVTLFPQRGAVTRALSWRPLIYLGEISFSLYLVHQLILRAMFDINRAWVEAHMPLAYVAFWVMALAGAAALFHLVENPTRAPLRRFLAGRSVATGDHRKPPV